jgi:hypothetical protein
MSRWSEDVGRVDWGRLRVSSGYASAVPSALVRLASSSTFDEGMKVYWELDNSIIIQGNLFEAAEFVVPHVLNLAVASSDHVRELALELLIQIVGGQPHPNEIAAGNAYLGEHCRNAARSGLAIFYALLDSTNDELRDRAVELLRFLEDDDGRKLWTMRWVETHDPNPKTRKLASRLAREAGLC